MDMSKSNGCLENTVSPVKIIVTEVPPDDESGQDMNSSYYSTEGATGQDHSYDTEFSETDIIRDVSNEEEQFADAREILSLDLSGVKNKEKVWHSNA